MSKIANAARLSTRTATQLLMIAAVLLSLLVGGARAQSSTSATDGSTPLGLTPGAPAGSYALGGFDNINPYNGNLNFAMPLLQVGGRGQVQHVIPLMIEHHWRTLKTPTPLPAYTPEYNMWSGPRPGYGPGILSSRMVGIASDQSCAPSMEAVTRLTFTGPDGTETELRDALTDGAPAENTYQQFPDNTCGLIGTASRGKVFVSADGSAMTYINDTEIKDFYAMGITSWPDLNGFLFLRDGTRYRIDGGKVTWIEDRNGNRMTFQYLGFDVKKITDSLNREVNIDYSYEYPVGDPHTFYDEIRYTGFGGVARSIKVYYAKMNNCLRTTQPGDSTTAKTPSQLFPELNAADTQNVVKPWKFSAVVLPDGRQYQFFYNVYGELARVVLPTGGAFEYDYDGARRNGTASGVFGLDNQIYRRVVEKRVYVDGGNVFESKTTFSRPEDASGTNDGYVEVAQYAYAGTLLARSRHYYYGMTTDSYLWHLASPANYSKWQEGKEWKTEVFDTDGTLKQRVTNTWEQRAAVTWWSSNPADPTAPPNDSRLADTTTTLTETNLVSKQVYRYDQFNNKTEVDEYDFGSGAAGPLKRRTHTNYLVSNVVNSVSYNYTTVNPNLTNPDVNQTIHQRGLPTEQLVYDGADLVNPKARTTYEYDNYTAGLTARNDISGHASRDAQPTFTASYLTRGNVTAVTNWLLPSTQLTARNQYDIAGNVVSSTDPLNRTTSFDFSDRFGSPDSEARANTAPALLAGKQSYAFATKVTNALNQVAYSQFDYHLGKPVNGEDANGVVNSGRYGGYADGTYTEALDRGTEVVVDANNLGGLQRRTRYRYDDGLKKVSTAADQVSFGDGLLKSESYYDGLGRTVKSQAAVPDSGGWVISEQQYDAAGRGYKTSNPYKSGETVSWTTTLYDGLGRVKTVTTPDSAVVQTSYSGNQTTVTDQAGKKRRSLADGLGRLAQVDELNADGTLYAATMYSYDVLDNLVKVAQGSQTRYFMYDSLKRLIRVRNPELGTNAALALSDPVTLNSQWSMGYDYDSVGNLWHKTDARNIVTTYGYDALNRVTSRGYTNDPEGTPPVTYTYDDPLIAYSKGKLTKVSSNVSVTETTQFDALGRVKASKQTTASTAYTTGYSYNLAGELVQEVYPSGRVLNTSYDSAGRLSGVSGNNPTLSPSEPVRQYLSQVSYWSHGAVKAATLGNGLVEQTAFNTRLQPTQIKLGTAASPASVLQLDYGYGTTTNNGNVVSQTITLSGLSVVQSYQYDQVSRLQRATETKAGVQQWQQGFSYDRFGNRNFDVATTTANVLGPNPTIDQATNRMAAGQSYSYDLAGNVTQEPFAPTNKAYVYDAENHQVRFTVNGQATQYSYDGDGRRVKKTNPDGSVVVFVYDAAGQMIAEYNSAAAAATTYQPSYLTGDTLGSTRVVTDSYGIVKSRRDYLPFGEEIQAGIGGRTTAMKYSVADGLRQRFTGHERDDESGLDFAQARYCSSMQGRFLSPDPLLASGRATQPQSWNRYVYTINNPLKYVDPAGLIWGKYKDNFGGTHVKWYNSQSELEASGATIQRDLIYETTGGLWIRLNPAGPTANGQTQGEKQGWEAYESLGQAVERTRGPLGNNYLSGQADTLNLFFSVAGAGGLAKGAYVSIFHPEGFITLGEGIGNMGAWHANLGIRSGSNITPVLS